MLLFYNKMIHMLPCDHDYDLPMLSEKIALSVGMRVAANVSIVSRSILPTDELGAYKHIKPRREKFNRS